MLGHKGEKERNKTYKHCDPWGWQLAVKSPISNSVAPVWRGATAAPETTEARKRGRAAMVFMVTVAAVFSVPSCTDKIRSSRGRKWWDSR